MRSMVFCSVRQDAYGAVQLPVGESVVLISQHLVCLPRVAEGRSVSEGQVLTKEALMNRSVTPGDRVRVLDYRRAEHVRRAITGQTDGYDFPIVWVCPENEWFQAKQDGREAVGIPWPAT